ncbi:male accessory gland serine protease inhibitor-like [Lucilia sericata]|uniref:male accessory gland serine protease inhibitor-like n=1 Tax=Lucilia sericata TaxID=13632 RepID=UPI0018A7EB2D|nr:male accessory gland serine protease inhibitor-like [Lucilia sericata]
MKIFSLIFAILALVSSAVAVKNAVCGLRHSMDGNGQGLGCMAYFPSWSYNADTNECVKFVYGGCGGNANRFDYVEECEDMCKE